MNPEQLHVTSRSAQKADQLSLIIPNVSMHGPPTSSTVLVNLGKSLRPAAQGFPLLTKLETRPLPALSDALMTPSCSFVNL